MERRRARLVKVVKRKDRHNFRLRWWDPETYRLRERSSGTTRRREAEREAARLEEKIKKGDLDSPSITWDQFRVRYEDEKLSGDSEGHRGAWRTTANWLEELTPVQHLSQITPSLVSRFEAKLRQQELAITSIASYLRSLRASLGWAARMELIPKAPVIRLPRRAKGRTSQMRSRPITGEEFERILSKVKQVRPRDWRHWTRFLQGLWHSGLRISELRQLSWGPGSAWTINLDHEIPMIRILAEGQGKRVRDEFQPITPEFWALIDTEPPYRSGYVFPLPGQDGQMTVKRIVRIISQIGQAAKVVTNSENGKCATSHDIGRRALTTRLGRILSQAELQTWMRHESAETTMKYYYAEQAQTLAKRVWRD